MRFQFPVLAVVVIAFTSVASVASAADLPVYKAPAPIAPTATWTGFYVGGTVGGMAATSDRSSSADPTFWGGFPGGGVVPVLNANGSTKLTGTAVVGGVEAGYNWQKGPFVLGIEADIYSSRMKANSDTHILAPPPLVPFFGTYRFAYSVHTDWAATLRGRAGLSVENALLYVTGGAAWTNIGQTGHAEFDSGCGGPSPFCDSDVLSSTTKMGWAVGGGVEYKLNSHWSIKGEYLHLDFGSMSANMPNLGCCVGSSFTQTVNLKENLLRIGGNYKF
jgi:outer membrane immunogenic protein